MQQKMSDKLIVCQHHDAVSILLFHAVAEAAINLDVSVKVLGRWIKEVENDDGHVFRGNGKLTPK